MSAPTSSRPRTKGALGAGAVGLGTLVANVFGYGLYLVLNRELSPADLGATASLLGLVVISGVPALSVQLVSAWRVARKRPQAEESALRTGVVVGALVSAVALLLGPVLYWWLHLDSYAPTVWFAATMLPTCVTFAVQGILQGGEQFAALGTVYALASIARTVGGATAAWLGWGVSGVMALTALGSWCVALIVLTLTRHHVRSAVTGSPSTQVRRVLAGMAGTSALLVASTIDTPIARGVLSADDSGAYAVLSLFTKAAFWGPAFLATVLYPTMSRASGRRPLFVALASTAGVVLAAIIGSAVLAQPLIRVVGGAAYAQLWTLVPVFTALGGTLALAQVLVYWGAARGQHAVGYLVWAGVGIAALVVMLWRHGSVAAVATTFLTAALCVTTVGVVISARRRASSAPLPY